LSRGQQKLLIIALYIAHVKCMKDLVKAETVVLIDDVAAELDSNNMALVINNLIELDAQVICTILDESLPRRYLETHGENCKMFHVEHGVITNVSN
jgi:DNA replication and repair protein RecF